MKMNTENYKNKQSEAKQNCNVQLKKHGLKVLEGMEKANKINEAGEFYTKLMGWRLVSSHERLFVKTGVTYLVMERWKQYFKKLLILSMMWR